MKRYLSGFFFERILRGSVDCLFVNAFMKRWIEQLWDLRLHLKTSMP